MRSLSYIIFLMSLIGNCQSTMSFHAHVKNNFSSKNKIENISGIKVKQLLKEFHQIIVKYNKKSKIQDAFLVDNFNTSVDFCLKKANDNKRNHILRIQLKTSKIRNKDQLNDFVLI